MKRRLRAGPCAGAGRSLRGLDSGLMRTLYMIKRAIATRPTNCMLDMLPYQNLIDSIKAKSDTER